MEEIDDEQEPDWFDELTEDQQELILKSPERLDSGERTPHEEAIKRLGL